MGAKRKQVGDVSVSQNGYHYTKALRDGEEKWVLTHWLVAEEKILGRRLLPDERVVFVNKQDRLNLSPDNIQVIKRGNGSRAKRIAAIEARIEELQGQLKHLKEDKDE